MPSFNKLFKPIQPLQPSQPKQPNQPIISQPPAVQQPQPHIPPVQQNPISPAPVAQPQPVQPQPVAQPAQPEENKPVPNGNYDSRLVKDVLVPDGTEFAPGQKFTKVWLMKNIGNTQWPADTKLEWVAGDKLSADLSVTAKPAQPNEEVEIAIPMEAPNRTGRYVSYYRMVLPNAKRFGNRVWVDIVVKGDTKPEQPALVVIPPVEIPRPLIVTGKQIGRAHV